MTDQELARALFNAGLLTQEQVQSAAAQRGAGRNFAQTVVALGWLTPDQIIAIDPNAFTGMGSEFASPSQPWQSTSAPAGGYQPPPPYQPPGQPPIPQPGGYTPQPGYSVPGHYTEQVNGTTILVLGILGLTCCGICAPIAWTMGNSALKAIDAGRANPSERGNVNIGRILGIIGTALIILAFIFYALMGILAISAPGTSTFTPAPGFAPAPGGIGGPR